MQDIKSKLIVALDVPTLEKAQYFVDLLLPQVNLFKVGFQLFTACGTEVIKMIGSKNAQVFLDLKFLDIPKTMYSAVASGTSSSVTISSIPTGFNGAKIEDQVKEAVRYPIFMMTLHTLGGKEALKAAAGGALDKAAELKIKKPYLIGVTVLTSEPVNEATTKIVLERAKLAKESGLDGVVCSVQEASFVKKAFGKDFIVVTPGIRPQGAAKDDQARVATAKEAIKQGADYIVVGRPIIESKNPKETVLQIIKEIQID